MVCLDMRDRPYASRISRRAEPHLRRHKEGLVCLDVSRYRAAGAFPGRPSRTCVGAADQVRGSLGHPYIRGRIGGQIGGQIRGVGHTYTRMVW